MKQLFAFLLLPLLLLVGCHRGERIDIADVTKPISLTLAPSPSRKAPINFFKLRLRGRLDGSARILASGAISNTFSGNFTIERSGNYTGTNCLLLYTPDNVTSGYLTIHYSFY
jgi:hypothetical protein